jgi:hypothetical protein
MRALLFLGSLLAAAVVLATPGLALVDQAASDYWALEGIADHAAAGDTGGAQAGFDAFTNGQLDLAGAAASGAQSEGMAEFGGGMAFASAAANDATARGATLAGTTAARLVGIAQDPQATEGQATEAAGEAALQAQAEALRTERAAAAAYGNAMTQTVVAANYFAGAAESTAQGIHLPPVPLVAQAQACFPDQVALLGGATGLANTFAGAYEACSGAQADLQGRLAGLAPPPL